MSGLQWPRRFPSSWDGMRVHDTTSRTARWHANTVQVMTGCVGRLESNREAVAGSQLADFDSGTG